MAEKESSFLTDKSFGGRFKRALAVALPSIALAKDNPYLVKSLYDKEEEFGKLDREDARTLIKSTASSITDLINKNKVKRQSRVDSTLESLTSLKGEFPELDNADIALIHKRNLNYTLRSIKKTFSLDKVDHLLNTVKEQIDTTSEDVTKSKIPNMTLSELSEAMAPAAKRFDMEMKGIRSAPASGPITSFVSGEMFSDEKGVDLTPQIQNIVKSSDIQPAVEDEKTKEIKEFISSKGDIFTEAGKEAKKVSELAPKDVMGESKMITEAEKLLLKRLGVEFKQNTDGTVLYEGDVKKYQQAMTLLSPIIKDRALAQRIKDAKLGLRPKDIMTKQDALIDTIESQFKIIDGKVQPIGFVRDKLIELKLLDPIDYGDGDGDGSETVTSLRDLVGAYKVEQKTLKDAYEAKNRDIINNQKRATTRANMLKAAEKQYRIDKNKLRAKYRTLAKNNNHSPDAVAP